MGKIKFLIKAFGNAKVLEEAASTSMFIFLIARSPSHIIEYFKK